ncbi:MAG: S1 domain-containing protein [Gaiellaceae bacterium]
METSRQRGRMLWFNLEKGFGFIRSEEDERLIVSGEDFLRDIAPAGRCAGLEVTFERRAEKPDNRAVNVEFPPVEVQRRARRRHQH